ncbi:HEAT repeat domain-containing protein [Hyalangium versicolor]|uniref:HEAT repeat domain-containing protein n=1 Tax=Hyalangium versicolor TaxID=2861190 RepID=UPI001CCEDB21|nr:HEAT repeat domain-containing protein [Hyalangium versicolor]
MPRCLAALSVMLVLAVLPGCKGDPKTPEYWEKRLSGAKRADGRIQVVESLRTSGNLQEGFLPMLHARLAAEKKPEVKAALARAIGDLKSPTSLEPLQAALDPSSADSETALANKELAAVLGRLGDPKAAPALVGLLRNRDNYTRVEAVQALGLLRAPQAVEPLVQIASSDDNETFLQKKAIEALGRIGDAKAVPMLMRMLTKERPGTSYYAESALALYQVGTPAADALLAAMEGRDAELKTWVQQHGVHPASYAMKGAQILGYLKDRRAEASLLKQLSFTDSNAQVQVLVRMQSAEALGRMRATAAVRPIAALASEEDPMVRAAYVRALVLLGGRDALPALEKAAGQGDWYAREVAMRAVAMLGNAQEQPLFTKWAQSEPALAAKECQEYGGDGCDNPEALGLKRGETILRYGKVLEAAKACSADPGCWAQKLGDKEPRIVERAALELGRTGNPQHAAAMAGRLSEKDPETRAALVQALDWMVGDSKESAAKAREALPKIEAQLADEKGNRTFADVNEDLRRLAFRLERA